MNFVETQPPSFLIRKMKSFQQKTYYNFEGIEEPPPAQHHHYNCYGPKEPPGGRWHDLTYWKS